MAKLIVADPAVKDATATDTAARPAASLREWLSGQWAVLFSHPEHFAPHPSTPAGFITLLADDFTACGVKPIAVASRPDAAASWLDFAGSDRAVVSLNDVDCNAPVIDLPERALAQTIARMTTPFVIIIDALARCRSTITYRLQSGAGSRTVEDVLQVVQVLRGTGTHLTPAHTRLAAG